MMTLDFAFKKIKATEALKTHLQKRTEKFEKFVTYPMDVMVRCSQEKMLHCVEITCHAEHRLLVAVAKTKDLYESIDLCAKKIEGQLKKEREKKKGHVAAHQNARPAALRLATDVGAEVPHKDKKLRRTAS